MAHSSSCDNLSRIAPREFRDAILSGAILTLLFFWLHTFSFTRHRSFFQRERERTFFASSGLFANNHAFMEGEKERQGIYERVIQRARCGSFSFAFEIYRFFWTNFHFLLLLLLFPPSLLPKCLLARTRRGRRKESRAAPPMAYRNLQRIIKIQYCSLRK